MITLQVQVRQHHLVERELAGNEQLVLQPVHLRTSQRKIFNAMSTKRGAIERATVRIGATVLLT